MDGILKAITSDGSIRAVIAATTGCTADARSRHNLSYTATAALGRSLTGAALVAAVVAKRGRVTMKFQGNGPLGKVVVDASPRGTVTGYVQNPQVELPLNSLGNVDVGGGIGRNGYLHVTVDHGFGLPSTSTVELVSGEVGEDINHHLVTSEQCGSVVILGTHLNTKGVAAAGGLLVQLLPHHTEETICRIENNIATFGSFTFLMLRGMSLLDILKRILDGFEVRPLTEVQPLKYQCHCSPERFLEALKVLGKQDLLALVAEEGQAQGRCYFCNATYSVGRDRLLELAN
jgi:molecular chaperone Hsp33